MQNESADLDGVTCLFEVRAYVILSVITWRLVTVGKTGLAAA